MTTAELGPFSTVCGDIEEESGALSQERKGKETEQESGGLGGTAYAMWATGNV